MISRRRMLTILGGVAALPLVGAPSFASAYNWRGLALGATVNIILDHPDASHLIKKSLSEITRLEKIFSLYKADSQLSVLNRAGVLEAPAVELIDILNMSARIHQETGGMFDPTIQPLWALYAQKYANGETPTQAQIASSRAMTGMDHLSISATQIAFLKPGMALTFNGIAQGYIADKVAHLLRLEGVRNVMINTGEISAQGVSPDGIPWPVSLASNGQTLSLSDMAIATSSPKGTVFDRSSEIGHIFDPHRGQPGGKWNSVSVIDKSAARADGLSTAFCLMTRRQIEAVPGPHQTVFEV